MVIAALLALALALLALADTSCDKFGPRSDCGHVGMSPQECEDKGCCWLPAEFEGAPHVDLPWCFQPNAGASEYRATNAQEGKDGSLQAVLELGTSTQPELGPDVRELRLSAEPLSPSILRVRLTDAHKERWEVPQWLFRSELLPGSNHSRRSSSGGSAGINGEGGTGGSGGQQQQQPLFTTKLHKEPFGLEVVRSDSGAVLLNTTGTRLVYKDQYLELTSWVSPSTTLFGAGERASQTLHSVRNGLPRAIWSHDQGPSFLEQNMYGSQPVVLGLEKDGTAWGMVLLSSNAMDVVPTEDRLSWRVTGGIIDLFLLAGLTPLDVMEQLTALVGRPAMMPYWSLGWHQCKYGYRSVWEVEAVVANYSAAGLPLEAIWTDIDHMDGWKDFTFHPTNFPLPEMQRFVSELHSKGQKWVPIVDPGIKVEPGYPAYDDGLREDVFMRGVDGQPYLAWVWPGPCHFPDFFLPRAQQYFTRQLALHRGMVPWDAMWIDMNEASNFCTGDICRLRYDVQRVADDPPWVCHLDCVEAPDLNDTQRAWLNPPYAISNSLQRLPLGTKGMSVLATHHDGSVEYNTHQLYGLSECRVTEAAVAQLTGKRPFVLSRASYLGAGAYAAHWTGDNSATWNQMAWSIPGVLSIGLWGTAMAGADICGFQGDTTPELCARWAAMGAFYPFSRDHSDLHAGYQELYRWPEVARAGRQALALRYRLLPYLYTALRTAHATGAPIMRPLWMAFPGCQATHEIHRQFMVGDALLVSPVLEQGADSVQAFFPPGTWHSMWGDGEVVSSEDGGETVTVRAPLGEIPVPLHLRGGTAVWMQRDALTTAEVKRSPLTAVLALDRLLLPGAVGGGSANGSTSGSTHVTATMYNDGGEELEVGDSLCHYLTLTADISPAASRHTAQVLLQFGSPAHLQPAAGGGCHPVGDAAAAAEHSGHFVWPELAGVELLGWHLPAEGLVVEFVRRVDSCGQLAVVERLQLSSAGVFTGHPAGLHLDLSRLQHHLQCPYGVRLTWQAGTHPDMAQA